MKADLAIILYSCLASSSCFVNFAVASFAFLSMICFPPVLIMQDINVSFELQTLHLILDQWDITWLFLERYMFNLFLERRIVSAS